MLFEKKIPTLLICGITYYKKYQKNGIICFQAPKGIPIVSMYGTTIIHPGAFV